YIWVENAFCISCMWYKEIVIIVEKIVYIIDRDFTLGIWHPHFLIQFLSAIRNRIYIFDSISIEDYQTMVSFSCTRFRNLYIELAAYQKFRITISITIIIIVICFNIDDIMIGHRK